MIDFIREFYSKMDRHSPDFHVRGVLTRGDILYPLGTDTKVLSTVFELIARPFVFEIAREHGLIVHEPDQQNYYPDFTLMRSEDDPAKMAVDVKSTYRNFRGDGTWRASFTLGGYTSFLRNETKNIAFPYSQYAKHYIIGFIYTRSVIETDVHRYTLDEREQAPHPISDVQFFVQEKYRIAGEHAGSGNTTNIGSIEGRSVDDFAAGNGPFAAPGERVFHDYWRNYGRTARERHYNNLDQYHKWTRGKVRKQGR